MDGRGEKMEVWSSQRFLNFKSMKTVPLKGSVGHTDSAEWGGGSRGAHRSHPRHSNL